MAAAEAGTSSFRMASSTVSIALASVRMAV